MAAAMKTGRRAWALTWLVYAAVAALGVAVAAVGAMDGEAHLVFGGGMFVLVAAAGALHGLALRPGRDDSTASGAEQAAWQQIGIGLAAILVLGGMPLGSMQGKASSWLLLAAYALVVAFQPFVRRRFVKESRRWREVAEDERDRAIRARGDYLSKRLLELCLVAAVLAGAWRPQLLQALGDPLHIAALLLLPVLAVNTVGEARVAWLYWRDRQ